MRQAGLLAAAGLYALRHNLDRLADDHRRARRARRRPAEIAGLHAAVPETNIVMIDLADPRSTPARCYDGSMRRGVRMTQFGPRRLRAVTHLDVDDAGIEHAVGRPRRRSRRRTPEGRNDDKRKALALAIAQIEKSCTARARSCVGHGPKVRVECIPTGAINLDAAIGIGGIPRGRVTEIYGPESSGKTTLCLHVVANAQRAGGVAAFIDAEHALDTEYAKKLGVDVENLLISQPDTGEQALEICEVLVRSGAVDIVVVDSVAALVPRRKSRATWARCSGPAGAPHESGAAQAHRRDRRSRRRSSSSTSSARRSA
jgi:hypothetical protein